MSITPVVIPITPVSVTITPANAGIPIGSVMVAVSPGRVVPWVPVMVTVAVIPGREGVVVVSVIGIIRRIHERIVIYVNGDLVSLVSPASVGFLIGYIYIVFLICAR